MPMKEPTMAPGMMRLKTGVVVSTNAHEDDADIDNDLLTGFCSINMFLSCGTMIGSSYVGIEMSLKNSMTNMPL
jgi:hypothetical protein